VAWANSLVKSSLFVISFGTPCAFGMVFMNPRAAKTERLQPGHPARPRGLTSGGRGRPNQVPRLGSEKKSEVPQIWQRALHRV
jgi:hypothetical protein